MRHIGLTGGRRDFIEMELRELGGSQKAVEFLYGLQWQEIEEWIMGNTKAYVYSLIVKVHESEVDSTAGAVASNLLGYTVRGFRWLDAAFREAQT